MNLLVIILIPMLTITLAQDHPTCTPCTQEEIDQCPLVEDSPSCERIYEPNCGCCEMCAKKEGQNCGVGLGYCETGLSCLPVPGYHPDRNIILENQLGKFVCVSEDLDEEIDSEKILSEF